MTKKKRNKTGGIFAALGGAIGAFVGWYTMPIIPFLGVWTIGIGAGLGAIISFHLSQGKTIWDKWG